MIPTHQVLFRRNRNGGSTVGCVCRLKPGPYAKDYSRSYVPIAEHKGLDEARELYNDPENHFAPFTQADRAKW